jgi:ATP-dependent helicase/nuclease subunit B
VSQPVGTLALVLLVVDHGASARAALLDSVAALQADDPLTPVTVVVPSPLAGLGLRRLAGAHAGFVNIRFIVIARLAELLGAPRLAAQGRRPLTAAVRLEAIHAVLATDGGPFDAVAAHPATALALAATFDDLGVLGEAELDALAARDGAGGRTAAVVRLLRATQALTTGCYDAEEVARSAATAVREHESGAAEVGHVVVHLPRAITPGEAVLLDALAANDRLSVILGRTGDAAIDAEHVEALAARLAPALGPPVVAPRPASPPTAGRLVSAPDPEDEVRAVAREVQRRARDGAALGRIAVLARLREPYGRLVPEIFDAAEIPWTGTAPRRVADTAAARVLLGLLALPDDDFARDDVAAWLVSGPVRDPDTGRHVNAARWDLLSREAGIVRGAAQWAERVVRRRNAIDEELTALRAEREASEWQLERLVATRGELTELARFVAGLAEALQPPGTPTWQAFTAWARHLIDRYVGDDRHRARWPDEELEAARRVDGVLVELGGLDALGSPVDVVRFRRALAAELDAPAGRLGRFGSGVLVGSIDQAYAGDFDTVYVLGAIESGLPPRGREDPLLPDRERRAVGGLAPHASRRLEERRDFLATLAAAPERILVFPRADARAQRKRLPAQWVLESARALGAGDLTAEALRDHPATLWLDVVESFEGLVDAGEPASRTEYLLRSLRAWSDAGESLERHPLAGGDLAHGLTMGRTRSSQGASEFTGFIGASPALAPGLSQPTSPTALQDWAACPFRYFLGRVLRLHEVPRPEETETISALEEGALIHGVLEEFLRDGPPLAAPGQRWSAADQARLDALVARRCDDAEARGITGRRAPWILARRRITATARRFLAVDERVRSALGVVPDRDGLECAFGDDDEPVAAALGDGRTVRFRGRIDRLDRSPDGTRAVVYDYKTGRRDRYDAIDADPVDAGRALQLPVYALAARRREGVEEAIACYWFTREDPEHALLTVSLDDTEDRFLHVVGCIVDGIASGCFPGFPGDRAWDHRARREAWESCHWCDFDRLCPVERGSIWERVELDPATAPFLDLELDPDSEGTAP